MRELFAKDGDADADAGQDRLWEGGADGEAVDEVVNAVAEDDHPRNRRDFWAPVLGLQLPKGPKKTNQYTAVTVTKVEANSKTLLTLVPRCLSNLGGWLERVRD